MPWTIGTRLRLALEEEVLRTKQTFQAYSLVITKSIFGGGSLDGDGAISM